MSVTFYFWDNLYFIEESVENSFHNAVKESVLGTRKEK